ncbi:substrate-binding domain-containing protein, partial [Streptomyces prunicolor]|uniref:substrate-binding domain-containing protein n=1 Tax=Streptomyces prunicolor TaxID=67348 RepID=UPI0033F0C95C
AQGRRVADLQVAFVGGTPVDDNLARPGRSSASVAGYDDDALSRLSCFSLTTVSQTAEAQARHAVTAAVERLDEGRTAAREVVLPPRLVVRGSTAKSA